mmetsp:Transcript_16580/g.30001  ORF Transcript_16580/g.30001 Transcript_16580/m.30001 type:complete len:562 (-) Transcript_16580:711-2396(-)|eukprot:CAMPEP_0175077990 /NCGR_PEP_ID=MMETSP0052_2-20121109/23795_1 /TAXON_ID=51329 ORGANISM="Polytomella parva, Strain SAG 63-3" /NCGR_SAMPLE_ID=MMETSP0052_2 /ASSEMBLY_ACC=CAM_ASM_000194 /LENGTH=561 /DNA_ID=CAMNT_0016347713 /DNA_START=46 /DNA_END=1731 /DNA_ORIENTATION=+
MPAISESSTPSPPDLFPVSSSTSSPKSCARCKHGPGYATPLDAFRKGPREELLYIPAIVPDKSRPDYLVTVDVNPSNPTYGQIIHRLPMPYLGDELHHSGWNSCSSCFLDPSAPARRLLVLPTLNSGRVYGVDVLSDPRAPTLAAVAEPEAIRKVAGQSYLHTSHCEPGGHVMVSSLGNAEGEPAGTFLLLDQNLQVVGPWNESERTPFGYDFWYQPRVDAMVSSEWGDPRKFSCGFDPADVADGKYGSRLTFWEWRSKRRIQDLDLGKEGLIPLEVRFLHEPSEAQGFVGAALSSNVFRFHRLDNPAAAAATAAATVVSSDDDKRSTSTTTSTTTSTPTSTATATQPWAAEVVVRQEWQKVEGWVLPELPPLITDILLSLDDKYLYVSNWLRGDIVQYDVSDPTRPKLAGRIWLGGVVAQSAGKVTVVVQEDDKAAAAADEEEGSRNFKGADSAASSIPPSTPPEVKGTSLRGGPQMIQLSLDGKRLYVTNSLYSAWDRQFYPDLITSGGHLVLVHVDTENGGLTLDPDFIVDFGKEPEGPVLAHEIRYPGGDCSSDIWI